MHTALHARLAMAFLTPPPPHPMYTHAPTPSHTQIDDNRFDRNFAAPPAWEARRSILGPESSGSGGGGGGAVAGLRALDLRMPGGKTVVAITGQCVCVCVLRACCACVCVCGGERGG